MVNICYVTCEVSLPCSQGVRWYYLGNIAGAWGDLSVYPWKCGLGKGNVLRLFLCSECQIVHSPGDQARFFARAFTKPSYCLFSFLWLCHTKGQNDGFLKYIYLPEAEMPSRVYWLSLCFARFSVFLCYSLWM